MNISVEKDFSLEEHGVWLEIMNKQAVKRDQQVIDIFSEGLTYLEMDTEKIPKIKLINKKLKAKTGFEGIYVEGLEDGESFYSLLADRKFPIGNFIRSQDDLSYTPAPDIIHDLYGHIPFLANNDYADFCCELAKKSLNFINQPEKFRQFERFFWFTIEFALVKTKNGIRIFGAGIASSYAECAYSLSDAPEVIPFNIEKICQQKFNIDEIQKRLFILENPEQLYNSLEEMVTFISNS